MVEDPQRGLVAFSEWLAAALDYQVGAALRRIAPIAWTSAVGRLEAAALEHCALPADAAPLLNPSPHGDDVRVHHGYTAVPIRRVPESSRSMAASTVLERKAESANVTDTLPAL